jgi:hypothetical protein
MKSASGVYEWAVRIDKLTAGRLDRPAVRYMNDCLIGVCSLDIVNKGVLTREDYMLIAGVTRQGHGFGHFCGCGTWSSGTLQAGDRVKMRYDSNNHALAFSHNEGGFSIAVTTVRNEAEEADEQQDELEKWEDGQ